MMKHFFLFFALILATTTIFSETVDEYLNIGERYFSEGRFHEARTAVESAIRLNPNYARAYFHLGVICYHLNDGILALDYLSRAIDLDNSLAEAYAWRAVIYEETMNDHAKALRDHDMAVYLEPGNDRHLINRAYFLYTVLEDFTQALTGYNRAIEINPLNYENFQQRGVCYAYQGLYEQALNDFNEAINLNSKDVKNFTSRGATLFRMERHEEAMEDFDTAVRLDSNNFLGYFDRGFANILLGRYNEAVLDFTEVIRINPRYRNAYFNRSVAYKYLASLSTNNQVQALHYLQKAAEDEATVAMLDRQN
ncbi:MAG: tetratricopeptide repeat protein [Treponema sp.]|jgi:tetratricopeptide (TPR) repeat protein|nr:tetratricopeptide repeat protein [Treponema sp.]